MGELPHPLSCLIRGAYDRHRMDEVSTCEITVKEGQHIRKGDETGMFHFGGSSHVLLFRKSVKLEGLPQPGRSENVPVRGKLAAVMS